MNLLPFALAALAAYAPPQRAAEARDAIGVNVHVEYTDGEYRDVGRILRDLAWIGVRHVRDAAPDPANQGQGGYAELAKAGVRFDVFVNGGRIAPALQRLDALAQVAPGALAAVEGPNEINNHGGFSYAGISDPHRAATAYQTDLYRRLKADPVLRALPVLAFTDWPYTPGPADIQNEHPYPSVTGDPASTLSALIAAVQARAPDQPLVFTEIGYPTLSTPAGVTELGQARLTLISLLDSLRSGVRRVYIYELLDAYRDAGGADPGKHWGLFALDDKPKMAAGALRRLTQVLTDEDPRATTFTVRPSRVSVTTAGSGLQTLVLQKASGAEVIALWRRGAVFKAAPRGDVEFSPLTVDLRIKGAHGAVVLTDPIAQSQGRAGPDRSVLRVVLGTDPVLVEVEPAPPI